MCVFVQLSELNPVLAGVTPFAVYGTPFAVTGKGDFSPPPCYGLNNPKAIIRSRPNGGQNEPIARQKITPIKLDI